MISHGAAEMLRERLFTQSDYYVVPICHYCGLIAYENSVTKEMYCCPACSRKAFKEKRAENAITKIELPYACKLLFQELSAMNIIPRIRF